MSVTRWPPDLVDVAATGSRMPTARQRLQESGKKPTLPCGMLHVAGIQS